MYTHKVICWLTVTKLVKFCPTLFFFPNVTPAASFTSTRGLPDGLFTAYILGPKHRLQYRCSPCLGGAVPVPGLTCASRQSFGSYLQNQDRFPGEVGLRRPGFTQQGVLQGSVVTGRQRGVAGAQGPHSPVGSGARCLEGPGVRKLSTLGPGLTGTGDLPMPHPMASRSQPVLSHLLQGATALLGNAMKPGGCMDAQSPGWGLFASLTTPHAPHALLSCRCKSARGCPGHPVSWFCKTVNTPGKD